ncbi:hypothetical protein I3842_06G129900 [Carya illinoinensis]|uniref:Serine-threonine/tyrosine-protein kinase catalytic domain-containing protein n=1 Tax=Carya illinoinensis TaxID=32201 RepID=A0A922EWT0_CARIL|nr:hypothetical protein I3842_06G129900 [Carya illinoinensis]
MSLKYAMEGLHSIKSDVFSFGVLLLEIVSGKNNIDFYNHGSLNLLRYPSSNSILVIRCINIGLLCVQESPAN